jgi:hypothetical protein
LNSCAAVLSLLVEGAAEGASVLTTTASVVALREGKVNSFAAWLSLLVTATDATGEEGLVAEEGLFSEGEEEEATAVLLEEDEATASTVSVVVASAGVTSSPLMSDGVEAKVQ